MIRCTVARVDLDALRANFRALRAFLGSPAAGSGEAPGTGVASASRTAAVERRVSGIEPATTARGGGPGGPDVIAVVKANAYGHGAVPAALALEDAGASMLACADIEEAVALREGGVRAPILVFGALSVSDLDGLFAYGLTPTISTPGAAVAVQQAAAARGVTIGYHLKVDTGMHRLGFRHDNLERTIPRLVQSPNLRLEAIYTHFSSADVPESDELAVQRERFDVAAGVVDVLMRQTDPGHGRIRRHASNSAALLRDSRCWYDAVRPGLLLYGIVPPPLASTLPLVPVMSLTSRIVAVKGLRPSEGVGYGLRYRVDTPRTIAVVPAGYADGLDTRLGGRGHVLVRGRRAPIVGAVSMDMLTIDVTDAGDVSPGDEVVILGRQGDESWQQIDAREMASAIGTIPWEIVCRLGTRVERRYAGTAPADPAAGGGVPARSGGSDT